MEKSADSADTSVLFFSGAVLIFSLCTQFVHNWRTCMLICPILTKTHVGMLIICKVGIKNIILASFVVNLIFVAIYMIYHEFEFVKTYAFFCAIFHDKKYVCAIFVTFSMSAIDLWSCF